MLQSDFPGQADGTAYCERNPANPATPLRRVSRRSLILVDCLWTALTCLLFCGKMSKGLEGPKSHDTCSHMLLSHETLEHETLELDALEHDALT